MTTMDELNMLTLRQLRALGCQHKLEDFNRMSRHELLKGLETKSEEENIDLLAGVRG